MKPTAWLFLAVLAALAFGPAAHADVPLRLTEQGRLFDRKTGLPINGMVTMVFAVYAAPTGGSALWTERYEVALDEGFFSVQLGLPTPIPMTLWDGSPRFIGIKIGEDAEMVPREEVTPVPYALVANDAVSDIHPRSVTVAGRKVIDESGKWTGDGAGLKGDPGPAGPAGSQVSFYETEKLEAIALPGRSTYVSGGYCNEGYLVMGGDCSGGGTDLAGPVLLAASRDDGVGAGRRWTCFFRNDLPTAQTISGLTRCLKVTKP